MSVDVQKKPRNWVWPLAFVAAFGGLLWFSGLPKEVVGPNGLPVIRSPEEYQSVFQSADTLYTQALKGNSEGKLSADQTAKLKQAANLYEEMGAYRATVMYPFFQMGRIYFRLGDIDTARDRFQQAVYNAPLDSNAPMGSVGRGMAADAYYFLAQCDEKKGDFSRALTDIQQSIGINKDTPEYYREKGSIEVDQNDLKHADKDVQKALDLDPTNDKAIMLYQFLHGGPSGKSKA